MDNISNFINFIKYILLKYFNVEKNIINYINLEYTINQNSSLFD